MRMNKGKIIKEKTIYQVELTPELGREWLKLNRTNRNLRNKAVEDLMRDIKAGKWDENNSSNPIAFMRVGEEYVMVNGQHRTTAVVRSGETVKAWADFEAEGRRYDDNVPRNYSDLLKLAGMSSEDCEKQVIAMVRFVFMAEKNISKPTLDEVRQYTEKNVDLLKTAIQVSRKKISDGICSKAPAQVAIFYALKMGETRESIERFCESANTGICKNENESAATALFRTINENISKEKAFGLHVGMHDE